MARGEWDVIIQLLIAGIYLLSTLGIAAVILLAYKYRHVDPCASKLFITAFGMQGVALFVRPWTHSLVRHTFDSLSALPPVARADIVATRFTLHGFAWSIYGFAIMVMIFMGLKRLFLRT